MTKDAKPEPYKDPPQRCPRACVHEVGHHGPCHPDDGTEKYKPDREKWKERAFQMMEHRVGKGGRPSKLSKECTVSECADHCRVSRQTLYNWFNKHYPKKGNPDPAVQKEQEEARKVRAATVRVRAFPEAAKRVLSPDVLKVLNPDARQAALNIFKVTRDAIDATLSENAKLAPPVPPPDQQGQLETWAKSIKELAALARKAADVGGKMSASYKDAPKLFLWKLLGAVEDARQVFEDVASALDKQGDALQDRVNAMGGVKNSELAKQPASDAPVEPEQPQAH